MSLHGCSIERRRPRLASVRVTRRVVVDYYSTYLSSNLSPSLGYLSISLLTYIREHRLRCASANVLAVMQRRASSLRRPKPRRSLTTVARNVRIVNAVAGINIKRVQPQCNRAHVPRAGSTYARRVILAIHRARVLHLCTFDRMTRCDPLASERPIYYFVLVCNDLPVIP